MMEKISYKENVEYILGELERKSRKEKETFRANAYKKAVSIIKGVVLEKPEDVKGVKGIGKGIFEKLQEIYRTGELKSYGILGKDSVKKEEPLVDLVYGIGPTKTKYLETFGISTVKQLREAYEDEGRRADLKLTSNQVIGMRYFSDIVEKIPREEIDMYYKVLSGVLSGCHWDITGSYRRGKMESGDIDVLIKGDCVPFEKIKQSGIIVEVLAKGDKKFMGITKLKGMKVHRRMDILIVEERYYYSSLLYFTGSQGHNIAMRKRALERGYTLNEYGYGVSNKVKGGDERRRLQEKLDVYDFKDERSLFEFIGMEYVDPKDR